jgi:putative membrane protein
MNRPQGVDRQREHQANERTFLAWLRTSIALIGFGFAIARFGLFLRQLYFSTTGQVAPTHPIWNSETLGISLVIFGISTIALAAWQYNRTFWQIESGNYRPNRALVWLMTVVVIGLGIFSIPLLLLRDLPTRSNLPRPSTQQDLPP